MGTHRTFLHCFKQMSDSFPSQQQPSQPLPAEKQRGEKKNPCQFGEFSVSRTTHQRTVLDKQYSKFLVVQNTLSAVTTRSQ